MNLLLTGFEPFGGQAVNPSAQVVMALRHRQLAEVERLQPDAVICLGEAGGRMRISIERVAINLIDDRLPDNAGRQLMDQPIVAGGPAAYFCTLPVRELYAAIRDAGVPVELSLSAGTFLCNQVTYTLLHYVEQKQLSCRAGFIHLPFLPEQAARAERMVASMSCDTMVRGLIAAITALRSPGRTGARE